MRIVEGDIWEYVYSSVIGIPTNGYLTRNGCGVLGRGLALQAKQRYPDIVYQFGFHLKRYGHCVGFMMQPPIKLISVPVKPCYLEIKTPEDLENILPSVVSQYTLGQCVPGFHCKADPAIIEKSLIELKEFMKKESIPSVHIPLLGCGNGGLNPTKDLLPILVKTHLPDSVTLVYPGQSEADYV